MLSPNTIVICYLLFVCSTTAFESRGRFLLHTHKVRVSTQLLDLKGQLSIDMKEAMKAKEKERLSAIRAILTLIKQKEVDDRVVVDDGEALVLMAKLVKQRKESITSYRAAGRLDLVAGEEAELQEILKYMPQQMSSEEIESLILAAIAKVGATTIKDMGKVMAELRGPMQGKADMSQVGPSIKKLLGG